MWGILHDQPHRVTGGPFLMPTQAIAKPRGGQDRRHAQHGSYDGPPGAVDRADARLHRPVAGCLVAGLLGTVLLVVANALGSDIPPRGPYRSPRTRLLPEHPHWRLRARWQPYCCTPRPQRPAAITIAAAARNATPLRPKGQVAHATAHRFYSPEADVPVEAAAASLDSAVVSDESEVSSAAAWLFSVSR